MRRLLIRLLKLPERPSPPAGSEESLVMFRASPNFLRYSYLKWGVRQFFAVLGILIPLAAFGAFSFEEYLPMDLIDRLSNERIDEARESFSPIISLFERIEIFALFSIAVQTLISGFLIKLRWEMRWYMVSDAAVRIREGLFSLREQTLTISKIQNMRIKRGPLQRLFGIADLEIETAGGGAVGSDDGKEKRSTHVGRFEGLDDVESLRERLRQLLTSQSHLGLGEPTLGINTSAAAAVREALALTLTEARRLRSAIERGV